MQEFTWIADCEMRLSSFLRSHLPDLSKQAIAASIRYHGCRVNGSIERFESYKVNRGDHITLSLHTGSKPKILYESSQFCIYDKPSHLSTEDLAKMVRLHIVHRLDRDTTGCILFAKTMQSADLLMHLFKKRKIHKQYTALVFGHPKKSSGIITSYTAPKSRRCGAVLFGNTTRELGKIAITKWSVLDTYRGYTLMKCLPITGRTHQIRLHMQTLGCPIVGDIDYGPKQQPKNIFRPLLHSHLIKFACPFSEAPIKVSASLSGDPRTIAPFLCRHKG
ncbi:RNA pseudouridylate synthase family protein [Chlamydia ibidis]|uniref:RNA pseudouridylate synthase family protein n=2 Tax=Chlamydia ibidis TaxID=1405396 RepID=S7J698_9CHLA|nr:RluA family pseudouridine synthase [Chlamydia ibidis]EPP35682.1 RNA pseudouridylate synthase family protein [Chlamydia ibidis]EQM62678.1 RNA pseudouridylate synthase family protein [Chlamydia ibidis 10-1398/6]